MCHFAAGMPCWIGMPNRHRVQLADLLLEELQLTFTSKLSNMLGVPKRKGTGLAPRAFEPEPQPSNSCGSRYLQCWVRGDRAGARRVVADDARLVRAEPALAALSDYCRESRRGVGHNHRSASEVRDREVIAALHCCGRQNVVNQASAG